MGKLTTVGVKAATQPGRYSDGDGLALVVKAGGSRSWVLRIQVAGRRRDFGCGSADRVTLKEARDKAAAIRRQFEAGLDPVAEKRKLHAPAVPTFKAAAERLHAELKPSWREGKHSADWLSSLERHAYAKLGNLRVDEIDGPTIRDTLLPIWLEVPETARRVRQRIGGVLDWAHANGFRASEAPLRSVTKGLPRQLAPRTHHAAMPYPDVPMFYAHLVNAPETMGRLALRFLLLTAARSGEVRGARWSEIDFDAARWTIPARRMKAKAEHQVPLSAPALAILRRLSEARSGDLVFFGKGARSSTTRPLSDMTLSKIMRDMKLPYVPHGFRSSFRDWIGEQTSFSGEIAESALAHVVKNPTERAYHRTRYFDRRVALMDAWAAFLGGESNVVRLVASA